MAVMAGTSGSGRPRRLALREVTPLTSAASRCPKRGIADCLLDRRPLWALEAGEVPWSALETWISVQLGAVVRSSLRIVVDHRLRVLRGESCLQMLARKLLCTACGSIRDLAVRVFFVALNG